MFGFQCGEFAKPVYFGLRTLKRDILGGVTGRDALSVAIRAADYVYRQPGGPELLRGFHDDLRTTAPSEMLELFPTDVIRETTPEAMAREVGAVAASVLPPSHPQLVTVTLRHRHSINGVAYGPGAAEVPEESAPELLAQDRRAGGFD